MQSAQRLAGWRVVYAIPWGDWTEVRLADTDRSVMPYRTPRALVALRSDGGPRAEARVVDERWTVRNGHVVIGTWKVETEALIGHRILDAVILEVRTIHDPIASPVDFVNQALPTGKVLWAASHVGRGGDERDWLKTQAEAALFSPSVAVTVIVQTDAGPSLCNLLVAREVAIQTVHPPDAGAPMSVAAVPVTDVPSRLLEWTGLGRRLSIGQTTAIKQDVSVRISHTAGGLSLGALAWREDARGELITETGPRMPFALASELLAMLPGGEVG